MKTAIITGASSEIGLAVCDALASQGFRLICQYSEHPKESLLRGKNIDFVSVGADFSDQQSTEQFVAFVEDHTASIEVIVHCAAKHEKMITDETGEHIFDIVARVNLFAPIYITNKLASKMRLSDNPVIIFISSTYAEQFGTFDNIYYAATKTALHTVSRICARELFPIRSNVIVPGYVDTPSYRLGRTDVLIQKDEQASVSKKLVSAQDIADTVLFIVSNKSVNAATMAVDGGLGL